MSTHDPLALAAEVAVELSRLDASDRTPPFGGWRNRAIDTVAARHQMNPYELDRLVRGEEDLPPHDPARCHDDCVHPNLDHAAEGEPCKSATGVPLTQPPAPEAPYVACPRCKSAESLTEQQLKVTWQPVVGLHADGDADDYQSFDYDDQTVVGYSCSCGWLAIAELSERERERIGAFVEGVLATMPRIEREED